ncbi:MepB family protein [Nocardia sp. NPDC056100]|uniref:MepB family protein n=1 Tax=Nocardia sp. NPDC056100 TaxID=3345712 RepID=UPI0035DBCD7A
MVLVGSVGVHADIAEASRLFERLGVEFSGAVPEATNSEYGACVAEIGCGTARFRVGKLTPTKVGLFVAVWRRAADGSTEPFAAEDGTDVVVVTVREGKRFGEFVFPTSALAEHGIVSTAGRGGKRGFRVYPPWSVTAKGQASRSQAWQCEYFLDLHDAQRSDLARARRLYDLVWPLVPQRNSP